MKSEVSDVRLRQFHGADEAGWADGVVARSGMEYSFKAVLGADGWSIIIHWSVPEAMLDAIQSALQGQSGAGPVVLLPRAGARLYLDYYEASGNRIDGRLEIIEDGSIFEISYCGAQFCKPSDLYGGKYKQICAALAKLVSEHNGVLPIEVVAR